MSGKLMGQCYTLVLSRSQREVLMAFCNYADDTGAGAYPSIARVAWMCDLSERQVRRIVADLVAAALLEPVACLKGGRGHPVLYRVKLSAGTLKEEYRKEIKADTQTSPFTAQKADTQASPFTAQKADMPAEERRTFRAQKADISSAKPDTRVSADPSGDPSVDPSGNTHTPSAPSQGCIGVCVEAISRDRYKAYARAQPGIIDPNGWATAAARRSGRDDGWDADVLEWEERRARELKLEQGRKAAAAERSAREREQMEADLRSYKERARLRQLATPNQAGQAKKLEATETDARPGSLGG
ncbi:MAG: helix-turn-helix domain-containing protein [Pyrinomonadaceae bacterium]